MALEWLCATLDGKQACARKLCAEATCVCSNGPVVAAEIHVWRL